VVRVGLVAVDVLVAGGEAGGFGEDVGVGDDRAGDERHELGIVTAVERKALDLLLVDDVGDFAAGGVEGFARNRGDGDGLGGCADLQLEVGSDVGVGVDGDAVAGLTAEAGFGDRHGVVADGEIGGGVEAPVV